MGQSGAGLARPRPRPVNLDLDPDPDPPQDPHGLENLPISNGFGESWVQNKF